MAEASEGSCSDATHGSEQALASSSRQSSLKPSNVYLWLTEASLYQKNMDACMTLVATLMAPGFKSHLLLEIEKGFPKNKQKL